MQDAHLRTPVGKLLRCPYCFNGTAMRDRKDGEFRFAFGHKGYPALRGKADRDAYYVRCRDCGTRTKHYPTQEQAIERWNKRVLAHYRKFGDVNPTDS